MTKTTNRVRFAEWNHGLEEIKMRLADIGLQINYFTCKNKTDKTLRQTLILLGFLATHILLLSLFHAYQTKCEYAARSYASNRILTWSLLQIV